MKNIEIEAKFQINKIKYFRLRRLLDCICSQVIEKKQRDVYYLPRGNDYLDKKTHERCIRIRYEENGVFLHYKKINNNDASLERYIDEYKKDISGHISSFRQSLLLNDFFPAAVVQKNRKLYSYKKCIIALDRIIELGFFVEIEAISQGAIASENKRLIAIAEMLEIKLKDRVTEGYSYLMCKHNAQSKKGA